MEYLEFAKALRKLARRADNYHLSRQEVLEELIFLAEQCEETWEKLEMEQIIEMQRVY
jgi:hypothetical protein